MHDQWSKGQDGQNMSTPPPLPPPLVSGTTKTIPGVESMSLNAFGGTGPPGGIDLNFVKQDREAANVLTPMGITSENVAAHFAVGRLEQDAFAAESHSRAHRAQEEGLFDEEILPVRVSECTAGAPSWRYCLFE